MIKRLRLLCLLVTIALAACAIYLTQPMPWVNSAPGAVVRVDPLVLETHVRTLSENHAPRDYLHAENLGAVVSYIESQWKASGENVRLQPYQVKERTFTNVRLLVGPPSAERVIVGAHYDTPRDLPGADDNASGVAVLIELGKLLTRTPLTSQVELVAYALEEPPYFDTESMGSAVHARAMKEEQRRIRAMVSLEMLGYYSEIPGSQTYPLKLLSLLYPSRGDFLALVGRPGEALLMRSAKAAARHGSPLPVHSINAPRFIPGINLSDHSAYWNQGFPAIMATDTAFFRNHYYHTAQDTADRLDYLRMSYAAAAIYNLVLRLSR